jgi:HAD superfamily hydrolase (TIGR01509 family)
MGLMTSRLAEILSRKRLLIFDFDGTLVDSSPLHARAFAEAFARHGVVIDYPQIAGLTTPAAVDRLAAEAGLTLAASERARLVDSKRQSYKLLERELVAIDGAPEFVRTAARRFRLALCTSGSRGVVEAALTRVQLSGWFDPIITGDDVQRGKPDPEIFLQALRRSEVAANHALIFEDADMGMVAAKAAGIEAVRIVSSEPDKLDRAADWSTLNAALADLGQ